MIHKNLSDYNIVGNKFYSLLNDESQHAKWEEFRNLARKDVNEDCSTLLQRMELEGSDEEPEDQDEEVCLSLGDASILPKASEEVMAVEDNIMKN